MFIELFVYEVVTTVGGLLGLKAISLAGTRQKLMGINQPKRLPVIDGRLRRELGKMSKTEVWTSKKIAEAVNHISKYHSFQLLIVMLMRRLRKEQMA